MGASLEINGYDLTDEGPGRTVNEDATLLRQDLGLFALADGAGGRGKGNVAARLALRTIENFVGATVRRTHERPDFDALGIPEQAKRLSAAIHRAHRNLLEVIGQSVDREGMATTVVAALFSPRTNDLHVAHVGDSRLYRLRHGRLELLTCDHTIATDILERKPEVPDELLRTLPRNSVVRALGMDDDFRVSLRSLQLIAGDRFLLCSDGLTSAVPTEVISEVLREAASPATLASELLSHALANRSQDNISVLVLDCEETLVDDAVSTRRYGEVPWMPPSAPRVEATDEPNSADYLGPEIVPREVLDDLQDSEERFDPGFDEPESMDIGPDELDFEIHRDAPHFVVTESEAPTNVLPREPEEPSPPTQSSADLPRDGSIWDLDSSSLEVESDTEDVPLEFLDDAEEIPESER